MNESEFASRLIEFHEENEYSPEEIDLESHFNYYGDRGVVDLRVEFGDRIQLWELKADAAIEQATGANEIIRQFNRMREYYFKDATHDDDGKHREFKLAFYPSEAVIDHLQENHSAYSSISESQKDESSNQISIAEVVLHDGQTDYPLRSEPDIFDGVRDHLDKDYPIKSFKDAWMQENRPETTE